METVLVGVDDLVELRVLGSINLLDLADSGSGPGLWSKAPMLFSMPSSAAPWLLPDNSLDGD